MALIDDLNQAVARIEGAVNNIVDALNAGTPDTQPAIDSLNAAAQKIEDTLNPPAPAPSDG